MAERRRRGGGRPARSEQWAELADLVLTIAREIQFRGYRSDQAVSLSPTEGTVMRHVNRNPGATASRIARATGLQRSNLSTVLRGLEDKHLIERRDDAEDGRGVRIHPTPRGVSNYALVRSEWATLLSGAAGDSADPDAALALLSQIDRGLDRDR